MSRGWPAGVRSVQIGGGPLAVLLLFVGRVRRALLRRFRPRYAARLRSERTGSCPDCTHDVLDGRDLMWVQNVCGYELPPGLRVDAFRDRFGLVRLGRPELLACAALGGALAAVAAMIAPWLVPVPLLLPAFAVWFFRDPERVPPAAPDLVLAPADGVLDVLQHEAQCQFFAGPAIRLGIYLSLLDVHVNRAPVSGHAHHFEYRRGARVATRHRGRTDANEQLVTWFRSAAGLPVVVRQIAGPAARRICHVLGAGQAVVAGQRFGLIKFGSRTELWLPDAPGLQLSVRLGQRMRGGNTVIANLSTLDPSGRAALRAVPCGR
ncbi:MAG TPA: phosphatidylserine decarboxylase [Planctomycetota bacterium]|nr:phosphatidylserine decarboxylase [Planctomycetota bacterium]